MCGRFTLLVSSDQLSKTFGVDIKGFDQPHYNIAPSQKMPIIYYDEESERREAPLAEWGLVPAWAKEPTAQTSRFINARAETVLEKPSFKKPFLTQRCLIPASGFYEWKPVQEPKTPKKPYYFYPSTQDLFCFAGLWEMTNFKERQQILLTFTIITTEANQLMSPYHHRMPVILSPDHYASWLGEQETSESFLQDLLKPCDDNFLTCHPVSRAVNKPHYNTPDCIEPYEEPEIEKTNGSEDGFLSKEQS
ncbi:MAG: SOS response-associated peptidase [Janthinobacterium lividum]